MLPCLLEDPSQQVPSLQRKEWEGPGRATVEPGSQPVRRQACWALGGLGSFPSPVGQQPGPCAPLSPCPPHSSAYSSNTVAFSGAGEKAGIGAETQIHARFSDKSLARNTGVRRDHKDVRKVKGPRPAELHPSIAPKKWQVRSQRHAQIRPPQVCTFLPPPQALTSLTVSSITDMRHGMCAGL